MNRLIILLSVILHVLPLAAKEQSINTLLARLDSMIANKDYYDKAKLDKIAQVRHDWRRAVSDEERYWKNRALYDEFFVYDADSAMRYARENIEIAQRLGNKQWEYEWRINKSFTLSVMGLLNDAKNELSLIDNDELSDQNKVKYYGQLAYLYSHISLFSDHRIIGNYDYDRISHSYEDSISSLITRDNPDYIWYMASSKVDSKELPKDLIDTVKVSVDTCALNSRTDAMNCYILSRLYDRIGDKENHMRYLILSGIADVSIANRDIASVNELGMLLLEQGDIDRAYTYVNYGQTQALRLPNRIRAAALAKTVGEVHQLHEEKLSVAQRNLTTLIIVLCVCVIILVALIILYRHRSQLLRKSQIKIEQANIALTKNMEEIAKSKSECDRLIADLQSANSKNEEISMTLCEANYVKEECIGATFTLCSSYIDRFEKYRKEILKLVKAQKWKELQEEIVSASYSNREIKDFYRSFDSLFLNIYPDFVSDFNCLLRPEEQINVNPGELNTELRIYALVRLGITDSVKIAALLHCSTQTVYNYRLRMRNKSIISKNQFADTVRSLGKYEPRP